ncbi:MAG: FlgD immunoglobulin-like domain containing protein [bacterium]
MFKRIILSLVILLCVITMKISYGEWKVVDNVNLIPGGNKVNGLEPTALCVLENKVYVANSGSSSISIIDTANNNAVTNINVGNNPRAFCVLGDKIYVANSHSNSVSIIDTANNNAVTNITVGDKPKVFCVLENKVYVSNSNDNSISIIDTGNNNAVTNINVGNKPEVLYVLGDKIYVADGNSGSINVLEDDGTSICKMTNNAKMNTLNYPNPFNPECYIPLELSNNKSPISNIKIKIYNILGQVVREVITNNANNSVYWDGRDNSGKEVSSGMYFYETIINNKTINCKKMLMQK